MSKRDTLMHFGLSAALCLGAISGPALAQDDGDQQSEPVKRQVMVTKLYEAFNKEAWGKVIEQFDQIKGLANPKIDDTLLYMKAQAHYALKEKQLAEDALRSLITEPGQEDHVKALYLLAKIMAESKEPGKQAEAQDMLLLAARAGRFVLRDITTGEGAKTFARLQKDPEFILKVMNASQDFTVSPNGLRNPFQSPVRQVEEGDKTDENTGTPTVVVPERLRRLEEQVEQLFRDINTLAEKRQVDELIGKFQDLRNLMAEYGSDGSDMVRKKMELWKKRLSKSSEVVLSIQLQIYIQEGNEHLRAMAESIKQDLYDAALERFERIKELKDQMLNEERGVFHRNAEALYLRGKRLADRAARLKRISEFELAVEGIIVAPPNDEQAKDSAIVNDRIYYEGDAIIDKQTEEEIPDLFVVEIVRSTVRFRYQDTEFVRELQQAKKK